jgi:glycosyltransferase involved in cell wall biosynthesis
MTSTAISVLEAMAYGIPVVAPEMGGLMEILGNGVEGFLIEGRNPKDFAEKCIILYENDSLRKQMGLAAREKIIKEFSAEHMAQQYYSLYFSLANYH